MVRGELPPWTAPAAAFPDDAADFDEAATCWTRCDTALSAPCSACTVVCSADTHAATCAGVGVDPVPPVGVGVGAGVGVGVDVDVGVGVGVGVGVWVGVGVGVGLEEPVGAGELVGPEPDPLEPDTGAQS